MISLRTTTSLPVRRRPPARRARLAAACVLIVAFFSRQQPWHHAAPAPSARVDLPGRANSHDFFGGHPLRGAGAPLDLGTAATPRWAGFLPWGKAPATQIPACVATPPPPASPARLPRDIAADLPGLYGAPWIGYFQGHLVAALHVTVPRDSGWQPAGPTLQIYRHGMATPAFSQPVPVSILRGADALLYRMYIHGPIDCIDLVIPNGAGSGTAHLYYPYQGRMFEAQGVFAVQR